MRLVATAALLCSVLSTALAQSANSENPSLTVNQIFGNFGFTDSTSIDHSSCRVMGALDKQTFLQKVPALQALGLLNPDLTTADINTKPTMLTFAFAMEITPVVTKETFERNPSVDICSFVVNLKEANVYGHTVDTNMLSYSFDRATFNKINWDQFENTNLPKVALRFSFNPEIMARVQTEAEQ